MAIYYSMVTSTFPGAGQTIDNAMLRCQFLLDGTGHDVL